MTMIALAKRVYSHFMEDSLYRNSIYLMINTFIMGVLGVLFWLICARLYSTHDVGLASTLVALINLVTAFSLLGLNITLIRYLPKSSAPSNTINTVFVITGLTSIVVSSIFLLGITSFSPALFFIKQNIYYALIFIVSMIFLTISSCIDSVFIAFRQSQFVLVKGSLFSLLKLGLPFFLIGFGAMGIFISWSISAVFAFLVAFFILIIRLKYKFDFRYDFKAIKKFFSYSFGNYITGFISSMPLLLLPLLITNRLGPEVTAHYYVAMQFGMMLFIIPQATTQSLFAEGSANEAGLKKHLKKSVYIITLLLVPLIAFILLFGNYLLSLFGSVYSSEGFVFLQFVSLASIFVSINYIFGSLFRIKNMIGKLLFMSFVSCIAVLGFSYFFLYLGLFGVGMGFLVGQILLSVVYAVVYFL